MEEVPARVIAKITCSIPGKGKLRIYQNAKITIHQIKCSISEKINLYFVDLLQEDVTKVDRESEDKPRKRLRRTSR